jgi:hypothetical protein
MGKLRSHATLSGIAALSLLVTVSGDAANAAVGVERYWTGGIIETEEILCDRFACPRGSFTIRLVADDAYGSRLSGNTVDQGEFSFPQPMEAGTKILSAEIIEESDLYHCEIAARAEEVFPVEAAINAANPIRIVKVRCTITAEGRKVYVDTRAEKEASDSLLSQQGTGESRQVPPPISPDAMPQRATGYGTSLFKSAVQQAAVEAQDPAARQARLQSERAALEEQIAREATSGGDGSRFVNSMLGVMQLTAAVQNARNGAQFPVAAQPLAPFQAQTQAQTQAQAIFQAALPNQMPSPQPAPVPGPMQPSQSQAAQQQGQFQAQQQAQVDAMNAEVARQAEVDRLQAEHLQEQLKYYPSQNQCAAVVMSSRDPVTWCVKNNCSVTIEVHFSGGMMSVSPGMCRGVSGSQAPSIFGICGQNDGYDAARQQCKGS